MTNIIFTCSTCNARIANAADVRDTIAAKDKLLAQEKRFAEARAAFPDWQKMWNEQAAEIADLKHDIAERDENIAWWTKVHEEHGGRYWEARYRDEAAVVAAKDKEIARLREALATAWRLCGFMTNDKIAEACRLMEAALVTRARERSEDEKKERLGAVDTPDT